MAAEISRRQLPLGPTFQVLLLRAMPAAQENVSVINDRYQVPIFEKLPVLGERASVAPVAALTWSMATYFQAPEAGSCWYW